MTTMTVTEPCQAISSDLFDRLVARVAADEHVDHPMAERIVREALTFLECCALRPDARLVPSNAVDAGWHAFLLHTRDYAAFCARVAGWFIHHQPADDPSAGSPADTVAAMRAAGFVVDEELWSVGAKCRNDCEQGPKCHQCHAGCHDSP
jgi:hypothetical protein